MNAELFSDDSRILRLESELQIGENEVNGVWDNPRSSDSGYIYGILKCGEINQLNVKFSGNQLEIGLVQIILRVQFIMKR